jgi:hypothetical protein
MKIGSNGYVRSPCFPASASAEYSFGFTAKAAAADAISCTIYWFTDAACGAPSQTARTDFFGNTSEGTWAAVVETVTTPTDATSGNVFCWRNGESSGGNVDVVFLKPASK